MAKVRLSVQISVSDLDATEAFYGGLLALPVQRALLPYGGPDHLVLNQDGCEVIFVEDEAMARAHPVLEARLAVLPRGVGVTLQLEVTGLNEIYQALLDEELEILYPLELKPYGFWEVWCFDPDGYLVVLEEARAAVKAR